jgi:hypothetical protein
MLLGSRCKAFMMIIIVKIASRRDIELGLVLFRQKVILL